MAEGKHLLVIDDADAIRSIVEIFFTKEGFEVTTARTAEEGLQRIREASPDVIILDVKLPDIDGRQLCQVLKNDPRTRYIPVILCTSYAKETEDKVKGFKLGADDYVVKPFDLPELCERVRALMHRIELAEEKARQKEIQPQDSLLEEERVAADALNMGDEPMKAQEKSNLRIIFKVLWSILQSPKESFACLGDLSVGMSISPLILVAAFGILAVFSTPDIKSKFGPVLIAGVFPLLIWAAFAALSSYFFSLKGVALNVTLALKVWGLSAAPIALSRFLGLLYVWITSHPIGEFSASPLCLIIGFAPTSAWGVFFGHLDIFEIWAVLLAAQGLSQSAGITRQASLIFGGSAWFCLVLISLGWFLIFLG